MSDKDQTASQLSLEPAAGIHPGVPFDAYRQWPGLHQSTIKAAYLPGRVRSMRRLRAALDGLLAHGDSQAMKDGTALHAILLEPERFEAEYQIIPEFSGKGSVKAKADFLAAQPDVVFVKPDTLAMLKGMRASIMTHPVVAMFRAAGGCEVSALGAICGLPCVARLDKWLPDWPGGPTIIDIKSVRPGWITEQKFGWQVLELGYDLQAEWYERVVESITGTRPVMLFIVCEKAPPYDVAVHQLEPLTMKLAGNELTSLLDQYKRCMASGAWPGYSDQICQTAVPNWYIKERRHEL